MNEMFDKDGNFTADYLRKELLETMANQYSEIIINGLSEMPIDSKSKRYILLKTSERLINEQKRLKINE